MKLSNDAIAIEWAFATLMSSMDEFVDDHDFGPPTYHRRMITDLPWRRDRASVPTLPTQYEPTTPRSPNNNKLHLVNLAAFEANYHDSYTPMSPDMHPLIIDTGTSSTVTPYSTDFTSPIRPVQQVEIKGIASGLKVLGIGSTTYQLYNDAGELQVLKPICPTMYHSSSMSPLNWIHDRSSRWWFLC